MNDELTQVDIDLMKKELEERREKASELREEVQRTREYGDLSENAEYKCAKQEKNRNPAAFRAAGFRFVLCLPCAGHDILFLVGDLHVHVQVFPHEHSQCILMHQSV